MEDLKSLLEAKKRRYKDDLDTLNKLKEQAEGLQRLIGIYEEKVKFSTKELEDLEKQINTL